MTDVFELEDHVDLGARGVGVEPGLVDRDARHLTDHEEGPVAPREDRTVHLGEVLVDPGAVDEGGGAVGEAVGRTAGGTGAAGAGQDAPVGQCRVLRDEVDDVHPEAVDAAVEPPPHHGVHRRPDLAGSPSSGRAGRWRTRAGSTRRWPRRTARPAPRTSSASSSARRPAYRPGTRGGAGATSTSHAVGRWCSTATRGTTGARSRCG